MALLAIFVVSIVLLALPTVIRALSASGWTKEAMIKRSRDMLARQADIWIQRHVRIVLDCAGQYVWTALREHGKRMLS